jgi:hypothetical protein
MFSNIVVNEAALHGTPAAHACTDEIIHHLLCQAIFCLLELLFEDLHVLLSGENLQKLLLG